MEGVDLQTQPSYYAEVIAVNTQRPPFDNVKVRQALNYALDKVAVRKSTNSDYAADAEKSTTVPPWLWTFNEDLWKAGWDALPSYAVDLGKAKQLLDESGVADQRTARSSPPTATRSTWVRRWRCRMPCRSSATPSTSRRSRPRS